MNPPPESHHDPELDFIMAIEEHRQSYMVSHRIWPSFHSTGTTFHPFYELLLCKRNGGVLSIGPNSYRMEPRSFFVIAPHQLHGVVSEGELHDYERVCIYVTDSLLSYAGLNLIHAREIINRASLSSHPCFTLSEQEYALIEMLSKQMHCEVADETLNRFDRLEDLTAVIRIFATLCRVIDRQHGADGQTKLTSQLLQVVSYIGDHYMEPLTLDVIAQRFNINKYYLAHEFADAMGTSVHQYLLVCRVSAAKRMIASGESMTETAYRCGFNDYSSFLRAFSKIVGRSPSAFRRRAQELGGLFDPHLD